MSSQFYYGQNSLTYRSDVPFDEVVDIEGMAVDDDMGLVWLGNIADELVKVVKGSVGDTYGTWDDYTDTLPSNGTKSLRRVK